MKESRFSALCLIAALSLLASIHGVSGQVISPSAQTVASRPVASSSAPADRPVANTSIAPRVAPAPANFRPQTFNRYAPRTIGQPATTNLRPNYSPVVRALNRSFVTMNAQQIAPIRESQTIALDSATRARELRTLAAMRYRRGFTAENATLAKLDPQRPAGIHDAPSVPNKSTTLDPVERSARPRSHDKDGHLNYSDACRRHWHEWHDRNWWHNHCDTIVFISTGYYFLDGGYCYPAWGYDPFNNYYDYDGPIYTYGNLLPDEVIANVQVALQDAGYYFGQITGTLSVETRGALANFQRDYGLPITGAIDEPTVQTLGIY